MENFVFNKIVIHNFLSMGDGSVDLQDRGFTLVTGENHETSSIQSNGSGKSTIFDAIFWTLTGETLRGATSVVNEHKAAEGCLCELDFYADTKHYKIIRTREHKDFGNSCRFFIDDEMVSDQIKKSQEIINKTIPSVSNPEILGSIILLGQGLPFKFSSFSPSKRKDLLEQMSGSSDRVAELKSRLDEQLDLHKANKSKVNSEIIKATGLIQGLNFNANALKEKLANKKTVEEIKTEVGSYLGSIDAYKKGISDTQTEIESISATIESLNSQIKKTTDALLQINNTLPQLNSLIESYREGNCPVCGKPFDIDENHLKTKQMLKSKVSVFTQTKKGLEEDLRKLTAELNSLVETKTTKEQFVSGASSEIEKLLSKIEMLNQSKDDTEALSSELSELTSKIEKIEESIQENNSLFETEQKYADCIAALQRTVSRDFKGYLLSEAIDYISLRSKYYSEYLFRDGKSLSVELSGNKILISLGNRLYENLSGGERQRVDLAVQFALRDMLVTISGFSCNLIVLDEAFDNLDAQGSSDLINLIVSEFSDIDSIFIITHHADIDIPYDSKVTVVKKQDGISYIEF